MHFRVLGCGKILGTVYGQERLKHVFLHCFNPHHTHHLWVKKRHWNNHYLFTSHSPLRPPLISSLNPNHPPNLHVFPSFSHIFPVFSAPKPTIFRPLPGAPRTPSTAPIIRVQPLLSEASASWRSSWRSWGWGVYISIYVYIKLYYIISYYV
jgi:hypothetical protein